MKLVLKLTTLAVTASLLIMGHALAEKPSVDELTRECEAEARAEGLTTDAEAFIQDCVEQKLQEDTSAPPGSYNQ